MSLILVVIYIYTRQSRVAFGVRRELRSSLTSPTQPRLNRGVTAGNPRFNRGQTGFTRGQTEDDPKSWLEIQYSMRFDLQAQIYINCGFA
jgi:hypothetical protein